jgi:hypothetical protein
MRRDRHRLVICAFAGALGIGCPSTALAAAPPTVTATPVSVVEGQAFSGTVGTISPCPATGPNGNVLITWGDGSAATEATVAATGDPSSCSIAPLPSTPHTYVDAGSYTTKISYLYDANSPPATDTSTAHVSDAPISLTAGKLTGTAGVAVNGALADLDDSGGLLPNADYTVSINWGDGTPASDGVVNSNGEVIGSHTFATAGSYSPQVTVVDNGGDQEAQTTATVVISTGSPPACNAKPPGPGPGFSPTATSPDERWVQAAFNDLLGRTPSAPELALFTNILGAGATRTQLAQEIEGSPEGSGELVDSLFSEYLHRTPTAGELNAYEQALSTGSVEGVSAQLIGSPEYFANRGGATVRGFLGALYCDTLDRSITPAELNAGEQELAGGTTRTEYAAAVLASNDYRQQLVDGMFLTFLRRSASPSEEQAYVQALAAGTTDQELTAILVGSQEYFNSFSGGGATLSAPTVTNAGVIHMTLAQPAGVTMVVLRVLPAVQASDAGRSSDSRHPGGPKPTAPRTRKVGSVKLGKEHAGHITIHWNRQVHGQPLKNGRYLLLLQVHKRHRLTDVSEPIPIKIHRVTKHTRRHATMAIFTPFASRALSPFVF